MVGHLSCRPARTEISTEIGSRIGQRKAIAFFGTSMFGAAEFGAPGSA